MPRRAGADITWVSDPRQTGYPLLLSSEEKGEPAEGQVLGCSHEAAATGLVQAVPQVGLRLQGNLG